LQQVLHCLFVCSYLFVQICLLIFVCSYLFVQISMDMLNFLLINYSVMLKYFVMSIHHWMRLEPRTYSTFVFYIHCLLCTCYFHKQHPKLLLKDLGILKFQNKHSTHFLEVFPTWTINNLVLNFSLLAPKSRGTRIQIGQTLPRIWNCLHLHPCRHLTNHMQILQQCSLIVDYNYLTVDTNAEFVQLEPELQSHNQIVHTNQVNSLNVKQYTKHS
jgi:hypothetical protein